MLYWAGFINPVQPVGMKTAKSISVFKRNLTKYNLNAFLKDVLNEKSKIL